MSKIALFGGSFDPVTTDHLNIAKACREKLKFDEVWFVPAFLNPFKTNQHSSVKDRLAMLQLLVDQYDFLRINEYEVNNQRPTSTFETVQYLVKNYPENQFSFIIGSDQLDRLEEWDHFSKLEKLVPFKVFIRNEGDENHPMLKKHHLESFTFDNNHLSSTMVRRLEKLNLQIPMINDYCNYHLLYLNERLRPFMDEARYEHCLNVGQTAKELANIWGANEQKALIAGTLHDITKRWDKSKAESYMKRYLPFLMEEPFPVWHAFTGYLHLQKDWLIKDQEILQAVFNHTLGSPEMSLLDIIVFCADKISPERDYPGVKKLRTLCFEDLMAGFKKILSQQYEIVLKKRGPNNMGRMLENSYKYWIEGVRG